MDSDFRVSLALQISPGTLQDQRAIDGYERSLLRIVAELMWLVSVRTDDAGRAAVRRRRTVKLLRAFTTDEQEPVTCDDVNAVMLRFGSTASIVYLTGDFVSLLVNTLNYADPGTNTLVQRRNLHSLICDLLSEPPAEAAIAKRDDQDWSDLTCQDEGVTADAANTRTMVRTQPMPSNAPDLSRLSLQESTAARVPPDEDSGAAGLHISKATPQDQPTLSDVIVTNFRSGNFQDLQNTQTPDAVIDALSSSVSVMRSLLAPINDNGDGGSMGTA